MWGTEYLVPAYCMLPGNALGSVAWKYSTNEIWFRIQRSENGALSTPVRAAAGFNLMRVATIDAFTVRYIEPMILVYRESGRLELYAWYYYEFRSASSETLGQTWSQS